MISTFSLSLTSLLSVLALDTKSKPLVTAHRYFTGYGQEHGGLRITLHNDHPTDPQPVTYYDSIPWFLKLYLHTLKVQINHQNSTEGSTNEGSKKKKKK